MVLGWSKHTQVKGLILAQNERWRRGLGMRVARECSNTGKRRRESSAMDESLTERRRVWDEGLRIVNHCRGGLRAT